MQIQKLQMLKSMNQKNSTWCKQEASALWERPVMTPHNLIVSHMLSYKDKIELHWFAKWESKILVISYSRRESAFKVNSLKYLWLLGA